ncbi:hypothetical protein GQ53DRAFT_642861, partial [Thozetella sp. PMI_491]
SAFPISRSTFTTASCPFLAARWTSCPFLAATWRSAFPISRSVLTTASCPFMAATWSGECRRWFFILTPVRPLSSSNFTAVSRPLLAAMLRSVSRS